MFRVRMARMDRTAVNYANARTVLDAERTMATAFATRDGWETIATMCARRDFMENIAWNSVRVHRPNSSVTQREDASAVWATMASIA